MSSARVRTVSLPAITATVVLLAGGCGPQRATGPETANHSQPDYRPALEALVAGEHRTRGYSARDAERHPVETLLFFGLTPDSHVVEVWPTAGWYTEIIAPFVAGSGQYYGAHFDAEHRSEFLQNQRAAFEKKLASRPDIYGSAKVTELGRGKYNLAPPGSADLVLTFRNVHNWTMGNYAADVFTATYAVLKPGGILGVTDHRGPAYRDDDPDTPTGYLAQADVIGLATAAGFVLEASSEINANPADPKNHPSGVWSLPPSLRQGPVDLEYYMNIGESDRMTLKFVKPEKEDR